MTADDFIRLARELRKEGLVSLRVADASFEATFAPGGFDEISEVGDDAAPTADDPQAAFKKFLFDHYGSAV